MSSINRQARSSDGVRVPQRKDEAFVRPRRFSETLLLTAALALIHPGAATAQLAKTALGTNSITLGSAATSSSVVLSTPGAWIATANDSFLHITPGSSGGTGSALVVFSIEALNSTGSRTGTLTIAGMTLTVTQAGTNYTASPAVLDAGSLNMHPTSVAVDTAGNLYYVGDVTVITSCDAAGQNCSAPIITDGLLQKVSATTKAVTTLGSGLHGPGMVAVDGPGNVYVADSGNNAIKKWTVATQQFTTLISGLSNPQGVAVDSTGDVYIADTGNKAIKKWTAATQQLTTLVTSLNSVPGVAVDIAGNVYFTESATAVSPGTIKKWTALTQQVTTLVSLGVAPLPLWMDNPAQLVVHGSGNLYFMASGQAAIWNVATQQVTLLASQKPISASAIIPVDRGVAVDGLGNVYLASYSVFAGYESPRAKLFPDSERGESVTGRIARPWHPCTRWQKRGGL